MKIPNEEWPQKRAKGAKKYVEARASSFCAFCAFLRPNAFSLGISGTCIGLGTPTV